MNPDNLRPHKRMNLIHAHEEKMNVERALNRMTNLLRRDVHNIPFEKRVRRFQRLYEQAQRLGRRLLELTNKVGDTTYKTLLRSEAKWHFIRPRLERARYTTGLKRQEALAAENLKQFNKVHGKFLKNYAFRERGGTPSPRKPQSPLRKLRSPSPRTSPIRASSANARRAAEARLGMGGRGRTPGPLLSAVTWTRWPTGKINIHKNLNNVKASLTNEQRRLIGEMSPTRALKAIAHLARVPR